MNAIEIRDLKKKYADGTEALKGIDLTVKRGDFFAVLGPNGAGKSTTIGILSSLINKTSGFVSVMGHDIDHEIDLAKAKLGIVPQEFNFNVFETVLQIVANQAGYYGIPRRKALSNAETYLKTLGLWDKRNTNAGSLSGGMKRRLMIARALVHDPEILILDEPTAGVDIELRRSTWEFLKDLNHIGKTIILTTHYLEEAESLCRYVAIIDRGRIIENCTVREILNRIDTETFILDLRQPVSRAPAMGDLNVRLIDEKSIEVDLPRTQDINRIFSELADDGIQVISMRSKSNRLEELFLRLVEKNLK